MSATFLKAKAFFKPANGVEDVVSNTGTVVEREVRVNGVLQNSDDSKRSKS